MFIPKPKSVCSFCFCISNFTDFSQHFSIPTHTLRDYHLKCAYGHTPADRVDLLGLRVRFLSGNGL